MKRILSLSLITLFALQSTAFAVGSRRAAYVGGTAVQLKDAKKVVEGNLITNDENFLKFTYPGGQ